MQQIITLRNGSLTLSNGLEVRFEEAALDTSGGGASLKEIRPAVSESGADRKRTASAAGPDKNAPRVSAKDFERDIALVLKRHPDGLTSGEIYEILTEQGWKVEKKKLDSKLFNMKKADDVSRSKDRKFTLSEDYYDAAVETPGGKKFSLNG